MRLIKMFGLAALAAVAVMAFIGASSASATFSTQACATSGGLVCDTAATDIHGTLKAGTVGKLLSESLTVLCLNVLANGEALALANPQIVHATTSYTNCGTTSTHNNCTVTVEEQPLFHLLKLGAGVGVLLGLSGRTRVKCTIAGFIKIDCAYDTTGVSFEVADPGILTAFETPVSFISGSGLCPEESTLDGEVTLVALLPVYIRS